MASASRIELALILTFVLVGLWGYAHAVRKATRDAWRQAVRDGRLPLAGNESLFSNEERQILKRKWAKQP